MGRNIGVTFEVGAKTMGTVASTFATVESRIKSLNGDLRTMQSTHRKTGALMTAHDRLTKARANYKANPTAELKKEMETAARGFRSAQKALKGYGINVGNVAAKHGQLEAAIKRSNAALARQEKLQANQAKRRELHGRILSTVAMATTVAAPVKLAIDYESAMADVKKVTNFDAPGWTAFSRDMLKLSTEIPMTADGLAQIAAAAGQAGIAEEELLRFTKDAAIMAVAFDISASEAGSAMTGLRTNFKLNQDGVMSLGDSFNHLANNMDATAGEIINFATRAGRVGTLYNFTGDQMGALGAAFIAMKMPAEVASRATNSLFMKLGLADKSTKEAQAAFRRLGLPAKKMAKMFNEDAQGALLVFLEAVKKSKNPMKDLQAIMGEGFADEIAGLVGGLDEYKKALGLIEDKTEYAGSMMGEYEVRAKTTANSLELMKNAGKRLGVILGTTMLPTLVAVADTTVALLEPVARLAERYPQLTTVVFTVGAALAGLMVVTLVGAYAATILSDGWTVFKGVLAFCKTPITVTTTKLWAQRAATIAVRVASLGLSTAMRLVRIAMLATPFGLVTKGMGLLAGVIGKTAVGQRVLNLVMAANPIGLVVTAVAALVGWFISAYNTTGSVTGALNLMYDQFKAVVPVMEFFESAVFGAFDFIFDLVDGVSLYDAGAKLINSLWDGVKATWEGIKKQWKSLVEFLGLGGDDGDSTSQAVPSPPQTVAATTTAGRTPAEIRASHAGRSIRGLPSEKELAELQKMAERGEITKADFAGINGDFSGDVDPAAISKMTTAVVAGRQSAVSPMTMPRLEQPAPQVQAPVTQNFNITMNGIPEKEFADRVVDSIKSRSGSLEDIIAKIVANIMARQKRLAYDS